MAALAIAGADPGGGPMTRRCLAVVALLAVASAVSLAQRDWNAPFPAHHVIDNSAPRAR